MKKYTPVKRPDRSMIVLVINTYDYKGATCVYDDSEQTFAMCPRNHDAYDDQMCMLKEVGGRHFAQLADESFFYPAFPSGVFLEDVKEKQEKGWYQNISLSGKYENIPWKEFIYHPDYSENIGIYEGAMGYTRLLYRSSNASCLNDMSLRYNIASRIEIVKRIMNYSGEGFTMEKFKEIDRK